MDDLQNQLKGFVLEAVANDYETFVCILGTVSQWLAERDLQASRDAIAAALHRAINEGYVRAYALSSHEPHSQAVEFSPDRLDDVWFYATPSGKRFVDQL
jgi:hypothetical protein